MLYVRNAFDTVWHNDLLCELYRELSIGSGLWLIIGEFYQGLQAHVIDGGQLLNFLFHEVQGEEES